MDIILNWVKPIIYFSIFITVMLQLLPGEKYTKYIRFFAGLLMIVLVIRPVLNLFEEGDFSEKIFDEAFYQEQTAEVELDLEEMEEHSRIYYEKLIEESLIEESETSDSENEKQ